MSVKRGRKHNRIRSLAASLSDELIWRLAVRCAWGRRDGTKRVRVYGREAEPPRTLGNSRVPKLGRSSISL